jgi:hypothetical protein
MCQFVHLSACVIMALNVLSQAGSLVKDSSLVEQTVVPPQDFNKTAVLISLKGLVAGNHIRWPLPVLTNRLERPKASLRIYCQGIEDVPSGPD